MTQVTNLGEWLDRKVGRRREFTSNRALAEHVGVSEGTIRNLRRMCDGSGKYHPTLDTLNKLSEAFPDTTLAELQRLAGLNVEPVPEDREERVEQFAKAAAKLNPQYQELIWNFLQTVLEQQGRENSVDNS